jgi:hypothetical protein
MAYLCGEMRFELPVAETKLKRSHVIGLHLTVSFMLLVTGGLLMLYNSMVGEEGKARLNDASQVIDLPGWTGIAILLSGVGLFLFTTTRHKWLIERKRNLMLCVAELGILIVFAGFSLIKQQYIPGALYTLGCLAVITGIFQSLQSGNVLTVTLDEQGIALPSAARKKFLDWSEVERVLLKFGILTIDCRDNRLFQWDTLQSNVNQDEFQSFCLEQIAAGKNKIDKNDW